MTQFNDGQASTFLSSLLKSFVSVTLDDCQKAKDALGEAFPGYTAYTLKLKSKAYRNIVDLPEGRFVRYRTHDGRLFHVESHIREYKGRTYDKFKLGEITSSMLISPEAIAMKRAGIRILDFMRANKDLPIKLNSFCHDDYSGEDLTRDKVFAKFVYKAIAEEFHKFAGGEVPSGMPLTDEAALKCLICNYSDK